MYFPILRGKRFELLALRESARLFSESRSFFPIIEPVRAGSLNTDVRRAAEALAAESVAFGLVLNPEVGELARAQSGIDQIVSELAGWEQGVRRFVRPTLYAKEGGTQERAFRARGAETAISDLAVAIVCTADFEVERLGLAGDQVTVDSILAPRARTARRLAAGIMPMPRVLEWHDPFPSAARNRDYVDRGASVFTDEHLYFAGEGLGGYADYATVGRDFREGGGSPNYVAIHWTYPAPTARPEGTPIILQHFCSTDSDLDDDVAGKFASALRAMLSTMDEIGVSDTPGTAVLRGHLAAGTFPGLGVLKKLSLINHFHVTASVLT